MTDTLPDPHLHAEFYADVPFKRFVAWLIDGAIIFVLTLVAIPFTAFTALFFLPLFWLAVGLAYRVATIAAASATPGMRLMAIELRGHNGQRFGPGAAALHTAIYTVTLGSILAQGVSVAMMLATPRGQGLGDLLLGSTAINRPARG